MGWLKSPSLASVVSTLGSCLLALQPVLLLLSSWLGTISRTVATLLIPGSDSPVRAKFSWVCGTGLYS